MEALVGSMRQVALQVGEVSAAAAGQSQGIGEVNRAVADLDEMTQRNAALVEQSTAAAGSLCDPSSRLARAIDIFQVGPTGAA